MKKSRLFGAVCALFVLAYSDANAYTLLVTGETLTSGDSNRVSTHILETDGATSLSFDTGTISGSPHIGGSARSAASVDLATGELNIFAEASGVLGELSGLQVATAAAEFVDVLMFDLPDGVASSQLTVNLVIEGEVLGKTHLGGLGLHIGCVQSCLPSDSGGSDILRLVDSTSGEVTFTSPSVLTVKIPIREGVKYQLVGSLSGPLRSVNSLIDLKGLVSLELEECVTFTSESGDFLSNVYQPAAACELQVDKQISCDGGLTWVDQGLVANDEDGANPCAALNGTEILARYQATNTGGSELFDCVLDESNSTDFGGPIIVGDLFPGEEVSLDAPLVGICSTHLEAREPNTATLKCLHMNPQGLPIEVSAVDRADVECVNPMWSISKVCDDASAGVVDDGLNDVRVVFEAGGSEADIRCDIRDEFYYEDPNCSDNGGIPQGPYDVLFAENDVVVGAGASNLIVNDEMGPLRADGCNKVWAENCEALVDGEWVPLTPPLDMDMDTALCVGKVESIFLIVDEEVIDKDVPSIEALADDMNADAGELVNEDIADKGVRDVLPIPVGTIVTLPAGEVGDEGWFALKETSIPDSWHDAGPTGDGLTNYILSGPGLGTGDDPEALLDKIPDVTPLRTTGLGLLSGTTVCALVYKSDISINYDPLDGSLKGDNRGLIAFDVLSVGSPDGSVLPEVKVEIVDAVTPAGDGACQGALTLLNDDQAPPPISSSEPSQ